MCWGIVSSVMGQQPTPKSVLKDAEFIIEKEHEHQLPESSRLFENAPVASRTSDPIHLLPSTLSPIWPTFDTFPLKTKVLKEKQDKVANLYNNYLQGGYGNFYSPYLEGFFSNKHSARYAYGVHLKHLSTGQTDYFEEKHNLAQLHGKLFAKSLWLGGDVGYSQDSYPLCKLDNDRAATTLYPSLHQITVHGILANYIQDPFKYQLDAFYLLTSAYGVRENQWALQGNGDYLFHDTLTLKTITDLYVSQYKGTQTLYRNLFRCKPVFSVVLHKCDLQGGVNLVYQNDVSSTLKVLNAYPVLEVQYSFCKWLRPYVGLSGDMQQNSLRSLLEENPRLAPNTTLLPTNQYFLLHSGVRGDFVKQIGFHTGLSINTYQHLCCLVNSTQYPDYFDVHYDPEAIVINGFGELTYTHQTETLTTRLRGDYYHYTLKELLRPWHRPHYQLDLLSTYRLYDKIVYKGSICWVGGIEALDVTTGLPKALDDIVDIDLGIDYRWNSRIAIFFQFQNLLARHNERYLHYPNKGFHCIAGLTYVW